MEPASARLRYRPLEPAHEAVFHALAVDPHVRRYLLDGAVVDRAWARAEIARAAALRAERGLGLWLLAPREPQRIPPIGFAGFRVFEELDPEPQLLYALLPHATGRGYATEAGAALLALASHPDGGDMAEVPTAVDEPNRASVRVLERLGFQPDGERPGAFGRTLLFRWRRPPGAA